MTEEFQASEHFYSIQGEGITSGVPSYFIRLFNCNLSCGISKAQMSAIRKGKLDNQKEGFRGDKHESGEATWTCDTAFVWSKLYRLSYEELIKSWVEQGILESILAGTIHLIWTGGEPTLPKHQVAITDFLLSVHERYGGQTYNIFSEVETNGTLPLDTEFFSMMDQINCSPKLANSGHSKEERIVPEVIEQIMTHDNYQFKFVISTEDDVREIFRDFIIPFDIPLKNVVCMPGLDRQEDFHERTAFVMEMAKKYKFIGLTRLHVSAWDQLTGV